MKHQLTKTDLFRFACVYCVPMKKIKEKYIPSKVRSNPTVFKRMIVEMRHFILKKLGVLKNASGIINRRFEKDGSFRRSNLSSRTIADKKHPLAALTLAEIGDVFDGLGDFMKSGHSIPQLPPAFTRDAVADASRKFLRALDLKYSAAVMFSEDDRAVAELQLLYPFVRDFCAKVCDNLRFSVDKVGPARAAHIIALGTYAEPDNHFPELGKRPRASDAPARPIADMQQFSPTASPPLVVTRSFPVVQPDDFDKPQPQPDEILGMAPLLMAPRRAVPVDRADLSPLPVIYTSPERELRVHAPDTIPQHPPEHTLKHTPPTDDATHNGAPSFSSPHPQ